jgi:hypothetical protein
MTLNLALKDEQLDIHVPHTEAALKHDRNKTRFDLIPPHAIEQVAEVLTYGANKYADRNYESGMEVSRVFAAAQRHLNAYWKGQDLDEESVLPHIAHAVTDLLILLELHRLHPDKDDRP